MTTTRRTFLARTAAAATLLPASRVLGANQPGRYEIRRIELFVRETRPGRLAVGIGKDAAQRPEPTPNPLGHVRMIVRDDRGRETFGCSADRLSVRWLDKRPGRPESLKLRELVRLIHDARDVYLQEPRFDDPFDKWLSCYERIMQLGRKQGQEDLTGAFASAIMERAMLDAVCRLAETPIHRMLLENRLGIRPERVHPALQGIDLASILPRQPVTRLHVRHTVGQNDPLTEADLGPDDRVDDGEPQTLEQYVSRHGITHFKVKIGGDVQWDLARLAAIWDLAPQSPHTFIMMDANEAYTNLDRFEQFVRRLEREQPELFAHVGYIEQPLPRDLTLDPSTAPHIRRINAIKPLIIDEANGTIDAFRQAYEIGYAGTSHKNCKGFIKSLLNYALIHRYKSEGRQALLSGEDLQNLPIVPLHQDFVSVGILGLDHCERNGHHYNYGLSMLSEADKAAVIEHHRDLYEPRRDEWFLRIRQGMITCASLHEPAGFGIATEPDFPSMEPMQTWLERRHG